MSNDIVTIGIRQSIGANEPLRTGTIQQDADVHVVDDDALIVDPAPAARRAGPGRSVLSR